MTVVSVALTAVVLLAIGYGLLGALALLPATSGAARPLLPILNTEAVIAFSAIAPFMLPANLRLILLVAFGARILWEAATVAALRRRRTGFGAAAPIMAAGAVMATPVGGDVSGAALDTVMVMPVEVVWLPAASRARTLKVCAPLLAAAVLQFTV